MGNRGDQVAAFIDAINQRSAKRILEMGTKDSSFLVQLIGQVDGVPVVELFCTECPNQAFDSEVLAAGERTSTEFQLAKYSGSESEINDTILELFSPVQLDAAFISSSSSSEALLTSMLVCHESLKPNGVLGLCSNLLLDSEMVRAVSSFRDLLGDAYHEISDHVFAKA